MQYEKISASNHHSVTITLSRSMAEFLYDVLASEVADDISDQKYNRNKLKRLSSLLWLYLKPTPQQEKARLVKWVRKLYRGRADMLPSVEFEKRLQERS